MRRVFDIIRCGIFKSELLERLRLQALKMSPNEIDALNADIQDCTSEDMLSEKIGLALYECSSDILP